MEDENTSNSHDRLLWNPEIAPVDKKVKNWGYLPLLGVWASIAAPNSMLVGSAGIVFGFNVIQVIFIALAGDLITLIPLIIQSHGAVKYGLAEPQLDRTRFGIWGTYLPSWIRFFAAMGFFGVQTFLVTEAVMGFVLEVSGKASILASYSSVTPALLVSLFPVLFWITFISIIAVQTIILLLAKPIRGSPSLKFLGYVMPWISIIALTFTFVYFISLYPQALVSALHQPYAPISYSVIPIFLIFLVSNIHATQVISWPDMMRFGKDFKHMLVGQIGLPIFYTVVVAYGAIMSAITLALTKSATYDPSLLIIRFITVPAIAIFILIFYSFTMLNTNIFSNVVPPVYDLNNTFPSKLTWTRGVLIITVLGILIGAWSLYLKGLYVYFSTWIVFVSGLLGPIAGIIVADYAVLKKFKLNVDDIYKRKGSYTYLKGVNPVAVISLLITFFIVFAPLYGVNYHLFILLKDASWISGFIIAFSLYLVLTFLLRNKKWEKTSVS
jgi:NCS1 family nucleobase:cation symporter-1